MKIEKLDNKGRGITYHNGLITFVNNALPDEEVKINIISENKKFYTAEVLELSNENKNRVLPKCPYYNTCGGCNLQHINIEYEDEFKENKVKEILKKYANVHVPLKINKNDKELFYRNKITLKIENGKWGFYNESTHKLCEISQCLIANNSINEFLNQNIIKINNGTITIRSNYENNLLLIITTDEKLDIDKDILPSNIAGVILNNKCIYKDNYFYDYIDDMKFKVSYDSFFQVNNYMAANIFKILRNNVKGKNLLDLYCGVGTLGLSLKDNFKNIYGIEKVKNAIVDAKHNAKINNVSNAFFYDGDTAKILDKLNQKFDTVIVDPPRSGLNKETLEHIKRINSKTIVYVSCDPMTLARDISELSEYKVEKANVLNMFPKTYHVESVVILSKKNIKR